MEIDYVNGLNLGGGFDIATYEPHAPALVDVTTTRDVLNANGQSVIFNLELMSSSKTIAQQMKVSARASVKYGAMGSGSAKASFVNSIKENSYTNYVIVRTEVTNAQKLLDLTTAKLHERAKDLFVNHPNEFNNQYGDHFVFGLVTGGEFLGVLEIESSSSEEFKSNKLKLNAQVRSGLFSGSGNASFQRSVSELKSEFSMRARVIRIGSSGRILQTVSVDEMIDEALEFPSMVSGNDGFPYQVNLIPYNNIEHPIANPFDTLNKQRVLEKLGRQYEMFSVYQNNLEYAVNNQEQFPNLDIHEVEKRSNEIATELTKIELRSEECFRRQDECIELTDLKLSLLEPILPPQIEGEKKPMIISGKASKVFTGQPIQTGPDGKREDQFHVKFPTAFDEIPKVIVSFSGLDLDGTVGTRFWVAAINIDEKGFDVLVSTWADSRVHQFSCDWIAHK